MNIKINSVRFSASKELEDFIKLKINKLEQFSDKIIGAEVYLKVENTQNDENKIAEIRLDVPGSDLFARKQSKTFEESTDNAIAALEKQIKKQKEKRKGV